MLVQSFISVGHELLPVEVELSLSQGLPQISFLGLPDAALKESVLRIRSAVREQGFQLPQAHQIIVQLRPTHLKKSSRGLDLAVAAALLWETGQIPPPSEGRTPTLYGELSLKGQVIRPDDLEELPFEHAENVYTGPGKEGLPFPSFQVDELKQLGCPIIVEPRRTEGVYKRPQPRVKEFPRPIADLAMVIAAGEHSALLAGPPGGGKSTLAEAIACWLDEPRPEELRWSMKLARATGKTVDWRPVVQPHHSITPLAMIGGGANLWAGEISRAHGGVLILDELLEFHSEIQEALREPVETGTLSIARAGRVRQFPARILLLATTNLCPCGRFIPKSGAPGCRCKNSVRSRSLARLSGPFVDRFAIFALTDEWAGRHVSVSTDMIAERVSQAIQFRKETRKQMIPNSQLAAEDIEQGLDQFRRENLLDSGQLSRRRRGSLMRVARTLADLRSSDTISNEDLREAMRLCLEGHRRLEDWRD